MREGWEIMTLADLFEIGSSKRVYESQWRDSGVPFYRAREIVKLSRDGFVDNELFIDEDLYKEYAEKYGIPKCGDIMVTGVGTLGVCYIVKENDRFYFKDGNILWLKSKKGTNPYFVNYAFKSNYIRQQIDNCNGATVGTFTIIRAKLTRIPVPSLSEQERIVSELDILSSIIDKKKAQLKELDSLAQSIFYEMFGDATTNEKGWKKEELQSLYRVTSSKRILQSEWQDKGVPFLKVADLVGIINGNEITPTTFIKESTFDDLQLSKLVPKEGDILVTSRGTLGQCYIIKHNDKFYFQDGMITWLSQSSDMVIPSFVRAAITSKSFTESLIHSVNNSTVAYISISQLSKKTIPIPPLTLQKQFAEKIEAIEHQKDLIKQSIKEVETLFNSRMDYYFN